MNWFPDPALETPSSREGVLTALRNAAAQRILMLDGAMGTQIQGLGLDETHFRGERFQSCDCQLQGNNDLLTLTQPQAIEDDPFRLCAWPAPTFWRPTPSPRPRSPRPITACEDVVYELNRDGARLRAGAPRSRPRRPTAGAASSPARSARPTAPPRCRPTSTIPATARSRFDELRDRLWRADPTA